MNITPTSASRPKLVERVSRNLTAEQLARGVFQNVPELIDTIERYITATPNRSSGRARQRHSAKVTRPRAKLKKLRSVDALH
jgi:hypothetical protein